MERVFCEYCGRSVSKADATYYESAGIYACPDCAEECLTTCERCGDIVSYDDAYRGFDGYLCDCCHGDLFG